MASDAVLDGLASDLLGLASSHGFPDSDAGHAAFDADGAVLLATIPYFRLSDVLRDDVWAFMTTVLVPDIVRWRYGDQEARHQGGVRNVLQRLWLRATAADRGLGAGDERWAVVRALSEDASVQIIERPGLAGASHVARALGERWLFELKTAGTAGLEKRMRRVVRDLLVLNQVMRLELLPRADLVTEIDRLFRAAADR